MRKVIRGTQVYPSEEALFRYGVVSQVRSRQLGGERLPRSLRHVAAVTHYELSGRRRPVSVRTLRRWVAAYGAGGIGALERELRPSIISSRSLEPKLVDWLLEQKRLDTDASIPELIKRARESDVLSRMTRVSRTSVYRMLLRQGAAVSRRRRVRDRDSRRFAFPHRMQMVLADGKHFRAGATRARRLALFFLDDATRLVLHVVVGTSETTGLFLRGLYEMICRFGLPQAFFLDNGPGFISADTLAVVAALDRPLIHGTAAYPEGHGKIERFNRTVKAAVLRHLSGRPDVDADCASLELRLRHYLREIYAHEPHDELSGQSPHQRFSNDETALVDAGELTCLQEKFTLSLERSVANDHIVEVGAQLFEVPRGHAGRKVVLQRRLFEDRLFLVEPGRLIEIFPVDLAHNARDRRARILNSSPVEEPASTLPPSAADLAFRRVHTPLVDADGGYRGEPRD